MKNYKKFFKWRSVFLSYHHLDLRIATELYKFLCRAGVDVWFDKENCDPSLEGNELHKILDKEIKQRDIILLIITENSLHGSWWVEQETNKLLYFKGEDEAEKRLILVLFSAEVNDNEVIDYYFKNTGLCRFHKCDLISIDKIEDNFDLNLLPFLDTDFQLSIPLAAKWIPSEEELDRLVNVENSKSKEHPPDQSSSEAETIVNKKWKSIFLSYSHKDEKIANELFNMLRSLGIDVWYAPSQIPADLESNQIWSALAAEVSKRDLVLLIATENSVRSWWVEKELNYMFDSMSEEVLIKKALVLTFSHECKNLLFLKELFSEEMLRRMTLYDLVSYSYIKEIPRLTLLKYLQSGD